MSDPIDAAAARVAGAAVVAIGRAERRARIGVAVVSVLVLLPFVVRVGSSSSAALPLVLLAAVGVLRLPREVADLVRVRRWAGLVARSDWERRSLQVRFRPLERHRPLLVRAAGEAASPVLSQSTSPLGPRLDAALRAQADDGDRDWWTCSDSPTSMLLATDDGAHLVEVRTPWTRMGATSVEGRFD